MRGDLKKDFAGKVKKTLEKTLNKYYEIVDVIGSKEVKAISKSDKENERDI